MKGMYFTIITLKVEILHSTPEENHVVDVRRKVSLLSVDLFL